MMSWILPVAAFILVNGLLGITTKLALAHITWPQLLLWAAIAYALISIGLLISGIGFTVNAGTPMALGTGLMVVSGFVLLFLALQTGDVSRVVPIGAAYPAVTVIAAAILLAEPLTAARVIGTLLVVAGVVLVSTEARRGGIPGFRGRRDTGETAESEPTEPGTPGEVPAR